MKKKIIISTFAIAAMALTAFTGYKTFGPKQSMSDLLLDENIEALTQGEEIGGYYKKVMFTCNPPYTYKQSITCLPNGNQVCSPADCF
jgi:hypothetical protein